MRRYSFLAITGFLLLCVGCVKPRDSLEPIINITHPTNGTVKSAAGLTIVGYALDDQGIAALRVDGFDLFDDEVLQNERFKLLIPFAFEPKLIQEGKWGATIEAEDKNGRISTLRYEIEIDATPPSVKVIPPERLGNDQLRVSGVARDNNLLGRIKVNDTEVAFSAAKEKFFRVDVPYADLVIVTVYDQAGNSRSWETKPKS